MWDDELGDQALTSAASHQFQLCHPQLVGDAAHTIVSKGGHRTLANSIRFSYVLGSQVCHALLTLRRVF
jgi:hypothetical protein